MHSSHPMRAPVTPDNLGPTLLLFLGLLMAPLGLGIPIVVVALARIRTHEGLPALPGLTRRLRWLSVARQRANP